MVFNDRVLLFLKTSELILIWWNISWKTFSVCLGILSGICILYLSYPQNAKLDNPNSFLVSRLVKKKVIQEAVQIYAAN